MFASTRSAGAMVAARLRSAAPLRAAVAARAMSSEPLTFGDYPVRRRVCRVCAWGCVGVRVGAWVCGCGVPALPAAQHTRVLRVGLMLACRALRAGWWGQ